jgi:hypothetical protein
VIGGLVLAQLRRDARELAASRAAQSEARSHTLAAAAESARLQDEIVALRERASLAASAAESAEVPDRASAQPSAPQNGLAGTRPKSARGRTRDEEARRTSRDPGGLLGDIEELGEDPLGGLFDPSPPARPSPPRRR